MRHQEIEKEGLIIEKAFYEQCKLFLDQTSKYPY